MTMDFSTVTSLRIPEGDVRSITVGGVEVWRKPSPLPYDAEVDWVQSTGGQYVDTGVVATLANGTRIQAVLRGTTDTSATGRSTVSFLGANSAYNGGVALTVDTSSAKRLRANYGAFYSFNSFDYAADTTYTVEIGRNRAEANGVVGTYTSANTGFIATSVYLFALNRNGSPDASTMSLARLYSCKIWQGDTLVRDLVPVRVGTAGALYDRVSGTLLAVQGTGALTPGPDKTS
jgi:hypothetical protein